MNTCKHNDDKICMYEPEHDCQNCPIFIGKVEDTAEDIYCQHCSISGRMQIKRNPVSGFRHVHGRKFIEAFDKAYKLK